MISLHSSTIAASIVLPISFLATIPTALRLFRRAKAQYRSNGYHELIKLYEDRDGVTTEDAENEYSAALPKYTALLSSVVGLAASLTTAVISSTNTDLGVHPEDWLIVSSWLLLVIQTTSITIEREPVKRYNQGLLTAVACLALAIAISVHVSALFFATSIYQSFSIFIIIDTLRSLAALVCLVSCISIPRRPSVLHNDHVVDGQYTVSAFKSYTFGFAGRVLSLARSKSSLELTDLPKLHLWGRSSYLLQRFSTFNKSNKTLWKSIVFAHWLEFLFQIAWAILQSAIAFAPQVVMYQLLKLLEQRSLGASVENAAWGLVVALGASIILASWIQAWAYWICWARLGQPIRAELSAMIFSKSLRRKDVKGVQKAKSTALSASKGDDLDTPSQNGASIDNHSELSGTTQNEGNEAEVEDIQKSRQSTINLVGVDAKRVSDFSLYYLQFPEAATELTVAFIFLVKLIGWESLLAGLAVFALVLPLNIYVSNRYSDAQDHLMKVRDQKMAVMTEALQGIRQIKFSAQEQQWQEKIGVKRNEELQTQWKVFCFDSVLIGIWILGPVMLSAVSLTVYAILNQELSASVAFTTLTVMGALEATLAVLPELISDGLEAWVSVKRIDEYFKAPERDEYLTTGLSIAFKNATIAWPSDSQELDSDRFILRDIHINFPSNGLSVITGQTGSGKSLLLAAILGEADRLSGQIQVPAPPAHDRYDHKANKSDWIIPSAIAFVAQIPWIENASIKNNVLFGLPFDAGRYNKVISCCALQKDLEMLPDGDQTDIGANGINLSGGQKWRISFARALYSRAGILVLDDIFSAVDAHVGRQLFEAALTGDLGNGRTRILVTHHFGLCMPKTDYAVILGEGTVQNCGSVSDLQSAGILEQVIKREKEDQKKEEEADEQKLQETISGTLHKIMSHATERSQVIDSSELDTQGKSQPKKFTEDEKKEKGSIKLSIYRDYLMKSGGIWWWSPIMCTYLFYESILVGRSWFIGYWTRSYASEDTTESVLFQQLRPGLGDSIRGANFDVEEADHQLSFYLTIYVGLSLLICFFGTLRYFLVFMGAIRASRKLFDDLTYAVLRAPLRWLDITPVGRILNRFTADFAAIDSRLGNDFGFMLYQGVFLAGIIAAGLFVSPWMLLIAVVLLVFCALITRSFLSGAREVKRLESNAKSPIFEQFGSVLAGIGTIRAFGNTDAYLNRMFDKIDAHARAYWHIWLFNRWLSLRLEVMGACFAILVAAVIVYTGIDASLAGFALSFALQYSAAIVWAARCYANVELSMNAIERVTEYATNPTEDQQASIDVPAAWPTEGRLEVSDFVAGYAPDLPPVLKGLSFSIEKNQRVGVVGRTGAGKSSLTLALFRFLTASEGKIHIDGIDISKISLYALRSRLAIIPQDPVLFSGTVRSNLDPFDNHTDAALYEALERVQLIRSTGRTTPATPTTPGTPSRPSTGTNTPANIDTNTNIFRSLSSRISEGGLNLSQGQRQLLCLARAIVSRPKIMVLDEATSAVDMATDALIQRSIREEFENSTLIVIAHRLSTIADFDRILVMEDGRAVEFESPGVLMGREGGVFRGMVEESGERSVLRDIIEGVDGGERGKGKGKGRV